MGNARGGRRLLIAVNNRAIKGGVVDFGDILTKWEKQSAENVVCKKDIPGLNEKSAPGERRYRLLRKKPDDSIDIHGFTRNEAWTALEIFFENSKRNGLEKLLVIHGKGNHRDPSGNEGLLKELTKQFIETCSYAGESGYSSGREGGNGSTWVILRQ